MEPLRTTLWCKLLGRLVKVSVKPGRARTAPVPGLPNGLQVVECVDKDQTCFWTGCPFTTDGGDCPFGEIGERSGELAEWADPTNGPSFENEGD